MHDPDYMSHAIFFGMMTPLLISLFICISRYISTKYNYPANDLQMNTVLIIGLGILPFMV